MIFLDTNICIHYLKGEHPSIRKNLLDTPPNEIDDNRSILFTPRMSFQRNNRNSLLEGLTLDQDAFLFNEETGRFDELESSLSNRYENLIISHRVRSSYRLRGESFNAEVNVSWQHTSLAGEQTFPLAVETSRNWQNLLRGASFQYRFSNDSSIRLRYNTNTRTPSARQLQDVVDNSNPLRMSTGNPDLNQQFNHNVNLRYRAADSEKGSSTMAYVSFGITEDYIGNKTFTAQSDTLIRENIILGRGSRLVSPENIGNSWNVRSFVFRSIPVDLISSNLNLNGGVTYSRTPSYIDGERNLTDNISFNAGTVVSSNINENIDFRLSYRANYNIVGNSINPFIDNNYYMGSANGAFNIILWKGLVVSSDLDFRHFEGLSNEFSRNTIYWNGSIGYKFLENRSAELRLHLFDILAQNNNINRSITEYYIEDYQANVLSRFMLMSFTYNFRSFAGR